MNLEVNVFLNPKQVEVIEKLINSPAKYIGYGGSRGGGKAQPDNSLVLTPKGFVEIKELSVGDKVTDPVTGRAVSVIGVHPQGERDIYKISFDDGSSCEATLDHLWAFWTTGTSKRLAKKTSQGSTNSDDLGGLFLHTTEHLIGLLEKGKKPRIPLTAPVVMTTNAPVKVDPYLIGLYLGDGSANSLEITTADEEIADFILSGGGKKMSSKYGYSLSKKDKRQIKTWLNSHGLRGKRSWEKYIPGYTFKTSIDFRTSLLQGLLDTDGWADDTGEIGFSSSSKSLSEGVQKLVWSLGGWASIRTKKTTYIYKGEKLKGRDAYVVRIKLKNPSNYFRVKRKRVKLTGECQSFSRRVVSIEKLPKKRGTRCITVGNIYGLYITNDFIVTHNSFVVRLMANYVAETYPRATVLILRKTYPELLSNHINMFWKEYPHLRKFYNKSEKTIYYPNGSIVQFGYAEHEGDIDRFQGREYVLIIPDESTHFTYEELDFLYSCNRAPGFPFPAKMLFTCNPGGKSHNYHKRIFIDQEFLSEENPEEFTFVPARGWDNFMWVIEALERDGYTTVDYYSWPEEERRKYFIEKSDYGMKLNQMAEEKRRAFLDGDWDVYEGMFFESYRSEYHEVQEFDIPKWEIRMGLDYGRVTVLEVQTQSPTGAVYNINECYTEDLSPGERAEIFAEFIKRHGYGRSRLYYDTNMDADVSKYHQTETTALKIFKRVFKQKLGKDAPRMIPVSKKRVQHAKFRHHCNDTLKEYLAWTKDEETGEFIREPHFFIFKKTCPHLVRSVKSLIYDKNDPLGLDHDPKVGEDHPKDGAVYCLITWKRPKFEKKEVVETNQEKADRIIREHIEKSSGKKIF